MKAILECKQKDSSGEFCKFYMKLPKDVFESEYIRKFENKSKSLYICSYMDMNSKFPFEALEGLCFEKALNDTVIIDVIMMPDVKNIKRLWKGLRDYKNSIEIMKSDMQIRGV